MARRERAAQLEGPVVTQKTGGIPALQINYAILRGVKTLTQNQQLEGVSDQKYTGIKGKRTQASLHLGVFYLLQAPCLEAAGGDQRSCGP